MAMADQQTRLTALRSLSDQLNRRVSAEPALTDEQAWENMLEIARQRSDDDGRFAFVVRRHQVHTNGNGAGEGPSHVVGPAVDWFFGDIGDAKDVAQNTDYWWEGFGAPPILKIVDLETGETWEPIWSVRRWTRGEPTV
jgi:hypothetical protein